MAVTLTVYSEDYPNNTKQVTVDIASRIPVGGNGDEKCIIYVYGASNAYKSPAADRVQVDPIFIFDMKRGWAQSFDVASPIVTVGGTLTVAIDEADSGEVTLTIEAGSLSGQTIASSLQSQLQATASGVKVDESNVLSYKNAQVDYTDGKFVILSGSTKSSFNDSVNWSKTSSVKVTGGTLSDTLGFSTGYPNSFSLATTSSGALISPASAHQNIDDAVRWAIMCISKEIDFSG